MNSSTVPYRLAKVSQLHTEDLFKHQKIFEKAGITCPCALKHFLW